jgi:hypothetical protein
MNPTKVTDEEETELTAIIQENTGPWLAPLERAKGYGTDINGTVRSSEGAWFIKAMTKRSPGRSKQIIREADINPYLSGVAPKLLWRESSRLWDVIAFEVVEGRGADLCPGSKDRGRVTGLLNKVARNEVPGIARTWVEERWDWYCRDWDEVRLLRGDTLIHSDIHSSNFILGSTGDWLVDWGWPTVGAPFIDPSILILQMISAGQSPEEAEAWASDCPGWATADKGAVDVFAAATYRMRAKVAESRPDEKWLGAVAESSRRWCEYRGLPDADLEYAKAQTPWVWEG